MFGAYFIELSRFIIPAILFIYILFSFLTFSNKDKIHTISLRMQILFMCLLHLCMTLSLFFNSGNSGVFIVFLATELLLGGILLVSCLVLKTIHYSLLHNMCMLLGTGSIILYRLVANKIYFQIVVCLLAVILSVLEAITLGKRKLYNEFSLFYACLGVVFLCLEYMYSGNSSGFSFWGISFHLSEAVLLLCVAMIADFMMFKNSTYDIIFIITLNLVIMITFGIIKDFGSALILFIVMIFIMTIINKRPLTLILGAIISSLAGLAAVKISPYFANRLATWLDPLKYAEGQGYQIAQSLFGIASGGWFGLGLGAGDPLAVPRVESDFLFSAICEELGIVFGILILVLCFCIYLQMCSIAFMVKQRYYKTIVVGISLLFITEVVLTVGSSVNFIPTIGVPFPLMSLNAGAIIICIICFYAIQGVYRNIVNGEGDESNE